VGAVFGNAVMRHLQRPAALLVHIGERGVLTP